MFLSRISFKLAVMIGISLAGMIVMAPIALYTMRAQMMTDRQAKTQQMVDVGYGILTHYQKLEADGKLPRADAQQAAIKEIKSLRYDKVEYFWINDMSPKMVMHPIKPELDGKDLGENKDPSGNRLFVGFVDVVDAVFQQTAQMFALVCLAVFALVLLSAFFIGRSVTRPLTIITNLTDRLASGDTAFEVPFTARKDEVGGLAKSLAVFKDNADAIAKKHTEQAQLKTEADAEKRRLMMELAGKFEASIQAVVGDVIKDASEMQGTAQGMSRTASQASDRSKAVAMASREASAN